MRRVTLEVVAVGLALLVGVGLGAMVIPHAGSEGFLGGADRSPGVQAPSGSPKEGATGTPTIEPKAQATAVSSFCRHVGRFASIEKDIKAKRLFRASRKLGTLSVAFQTDADLFDAAGDFGTGNWLRGSAGFVARPESLPDLFQMATFYTQRCSELRRDLSA